VLYKLPINENENYLFRVLFLFENQGVFICSHFFSKTLKLFVAACVYMCARSNTFILYRKYFEKISGGFFGVLAMSPTHLRRTSPSLIFSLLSPEEKPRTQETQSVTFGRREVRWKSLHEGSPTATLFDVCLDPPGFRKLSPPHGYQHVCTVFYW
jgi:hypothetical protein